jgi:hypothetical protein
MRDKVVYKEMMEQQESVMGIPTTALNVD